MTLEEARRPAVVDGVGVALATTASARGRAARPRARRARPRSTCSRTTSSTTRARAGRRGSTRSSRRESLDVLRADVLALRRVGRRPRRRVPQGNRSRPVRRARLRARARADGDRLRRRRRRRPPRAHPARDRGLPRQAGLPRSRQLRRRHARAHAVSGKRATELAAWSKRRRELFGFEPDPAMPFYPFHPESRNTMIADCRIDGRRRRRGLRPVLDRRPRPARSARAARRGPAYVERITARPASTPVHARTASASRFRRDAGERQRLGPVDRPAEHLGLPRALERRRPREQLLERDPELRPRHGRAGALVRAVAEREVRVRRAAEPEAPRARRRPRGRGSPTEARARPSRPRGSCGRGPRGRGSRSARSPGSARRAGAAPRARPGSAPDRREALPAARVAGEVVDGAREEAPSARRARRSAAVGGCRRRTRRRAARRRSAPRAAR